MNKTKQYLPYIGIVGLAIAISILGYIFYPRIADSNLVFALTTFIVGSFAIFFYVKEKSDEKSNAARILFLELKESEKELKKLIEHKIRTEGKNYPQENIIKLLQNRSWTKYSHLFIENFNNDEYQQLDEYFKKCDILERYFEKQHNFFWVSTEERARQQEIIGAKLAYDNLQMTPQDFKDRLGLISDLYIANTGNYAPSGITNEINKQLEGIILLSVTPLWSKLKELAGYSS